MKRIILSFLLLLPCVASAQMQYVGDFYLGDTVRCGWNTFDTAGASVTRATNGSVIVYEDSGTTEITAGITDTEDFDTQTGLHDIVIVATSANGFEAGKDYRAAIDAATIDGNSITAWLCAFSIENRAPLKDYILARGTADTDDTTPGKIIFVEDIITTNGEFVTRTLWNRDTGEKYAITDCQTVAGPDDYCTFAPDVFTTETLNDRMYILNEGPTYVLDIETEVTNGLGTYWGLTAQGRSNAAVVFDNGASATTHTIDDIGDAVANIGTPSDLGSGATLAGNAGDIDAAIVDLTDGTTPTWPLGQVLVNSTADSGSTASLVDAALTQADNAWFRNATRITFTSGTLDGQTACVDTFTAASDTITFSPPVTTAVVTHTFVLSADAGCARGR